MFTSGDSTGVLCVYIFKEELINDNDMKNMFDNSYYKLLNEIKGLENPTSENICIFIWDRLIKDIPDLYQIEIKENNVTGFIYSGE